MVVMRVITKSSSLHGLSGAAVLPVDQACVKTLGARCAPGQGKLVGFPWDR
jgi:hypothetical protein